MIGSCGWKDLRQVRNGSCTSTGSHMGPNYADSSPATAFRRCFDGFSSHQVGSQRLGYRVAPVNCDLRASV